MHWINLECYLCRLELVEEAKVAFKALDVDGSGFLEKEELRPVISKWANSNSRSFKESPESVLDNLLNSLDIDQNGKVDIKEFIEGFDSLMYEKKVKDAGVVEALRADQSP
jgi:Ca2+-binding EF-hand superfamily protein